MVSIFDVLIAFHTDEVRQHIFITPAVIAEIAPAIIIGAVAANVHHVVNSARTPEDLATRLENAPAVQMPLRNCAITPIVMGVLKLRVSAGDARQRRALLSPRLDQQD